MLLSLFLSLFFTATESCWETNQANHVSKVPSSRIVNYLSECVGAKVPFDPIYSELDMTRVVGETGNVQARQFMSTFMSDLGWHVELDTFTQDTVIGERTFTNIIATRNVNSPRRLVLAAHYDSKISPDSFIGATDSAVPCAMMLHLAQSMDTILPSVTSDPELTLQFIFFDGEEAFKQWTSTDSLYGSRHLAKLWSEQDYTYSGDQFCQNSEAKMMDRIDNFVLLDLLGVPEPKFSRFTLYNTSMYDYAFQAESAVQSVTGDNIARVFTNIDRGSNIQDDQLPFYNLDMKKILHMIASPFPRVWHTLDDNADALDTTTINYLNKILRVIVYGYLYGNSSK